jgi:hypothetical protein
VTLKDAIDNFRTLSGKASDLCRQLALAGLAIVWIFREAQTGKIGPELVRSAALFVAALGCDLLHYSVASLIWFVFYRRQEKRGKEPESEVEAPAAINWPANTLFVGKIGLLIAGYVMLGVYLWRRLL